MLPQIKFMSIIYCLFYQWGGGCFTFMQEAEEVQASGGNAHWQPDGWRQGVCREREREISVSCCSSAYGQIRGKEMKRNRLGQKNQSVRNRSELHWFQVEEENPSGDYWDLKISECSFLVRFEDILRQSFPLKLERWNYSTWPKRFLKDLNTAICYVPFASGLVKGIVGNVGKQDTVR